MANALIEYDDEKLRLKDIEKFIKQAGFESLGIYNEKSGGSLNSIFSFANTSLPEEVMR